MRGETFEIELRRTAREILGVGVGGCGSRQRCGVHDDSRLLSDGRDELVAVSRGERGQRGQQLVVDERFVLGPRLPAQGGAARGRDEELLERLRGLEAGGRRRGDGLREVTVETGALEGRLVEPDPGRGGGGGGSVVDAQPSEAAQPLERDVGADVLEHLLEVGLEELVAEHLGVDVGDDERARQLVVGLVLVSVGVWRALRGAPQGREPQELRGQVGKAVGPIDVGRLGLRLGVGFRVGAIARRGGRGWTVRPRRRHAVAEREPVDGRQSEKVTLPHLRKMTAALTFRYTAMHVLCAIGPFDDSFVYNMSITRFENNNYFILHVYCSILVYFRI